MQLTISMIGQPMKSCEMNRADIVVDGRPFRFDALREYQASKRLRGLCGIRFIDTENTLFRLQSENRERLRREREEKKNQ